MKRAPFRPAPRTALIDALRQFRELHQWHNRLLLDPQADRATIAEVAEEVGRAERKVLKLESMREAR